MKELLFIITLPVSLPIFIVMITVRGANAFYYAIFKESFKDSL